MNALKFLNKTFNKIHLLLFFIPVFAYSQINFYDKFELYDTIALSNDVIVGNISHLDIDNKGRMLITDRLSVKTHLYNKNGKYLKTLSPEDCNPGFDWRPYQAAFNKSGNILALNSGFSGYRFDSLGNCIGGMALSFLQPLHISFLNDGSLIGYYNLDDGNHLKAMSYKGEEKFRFGEFPAEYKNLIFRFEGGGLAADKNDYIYQLNVSSPVIRKYNKRGSLITDFVEYPDYFKKVEKDFPADPASVLANVGKILKDKTLSLQLFLFDENKLLSVLSNNKKYGIQIYNTNGKYLLKEDIFIDKMILNCKNGLVYLSYQPEPDNSGNLPNPIIKIYKIKEDIINE